MINMASGTLFFETTKGHVFECDSFGFLFVTINTLDLRVFAIECVTRGFFVIKVIDLPVGLSVTFETLVTSSELSSELSFMLIFVTG